MNSVIKGTSYVLVHTPDLVLQSGTTQTTERIVNPDSEYLKALPGHLRSYEQAVGYLPNQTYIGNMTPEQLGAVAQPWYEAPAQGGREGRLGEIMPEDEFYLLMQACDVFDLMFLEKGFVEAVKPKLERHPLVTQELLGRIRAGVEAAEIEHFVNEEHAEPIVCEGRLAGYIKRAHDVDVNLSAHVMLENIVSKATSVLSLLHLVKNAGVEKESIEYVIDCCEEACGDMNQRGGGNFAKAAAEIAGLSGASGCDVRGFCAGPAHAVITAASLVKAGTYKSVAVTAGGCTAKLGMNGKDHVRKGMPILEDMLGGFSVLITANDGISPEIDTRFCGRHTVGTGASPQAVLSSLVLDPLQKAGLKITDIDRYAVEMQNPDITKPAGAGDVPLANYKMIGALAVKNGELDRKELADFVSRHGMCGWAPTQGHIPSGVPYLGFCCDDIRAGRIRRAMIVGKGSLFLGRMTNLFDGVSFLVHENTAAEAESGISEQQVRRLIAQALREFAAALSSEKAGEEA